MEGFPAYCPNCQMAFVMPNFIAGFGNIHMNGTVTNCPRCGGTAQIGDGHYQINAGDVDLVAGWPGTVQMFNALRGVAERAKAKAKEGAAQAEEILAEVAEVSPELAKKLRAKHSLPVFALILLLIWLVKSVELNIKVDLNHMIDQAYHLSQGQDPEAHLDAPPPIAPAQAPLKPAQPGLPPATLAAQQVGPQNRQARRRQRAQARTRPKGPSRL